MEKRIETERLVLRPWCAGDAGALYELARDPEVGAPAGWPPHESVEQSRQIIETVFNTPYVYAVVLKETGEPVGCCGLVAPTPEHSATVAADDAEIGYWLGRAFWGRGLMPEAVTAVAPRHVPKDAGASGSPFTTATIARAAWPRSADSATTTPKSTAV